MAESALSTAAQHALDEVAAQLDGYAALVQGLCAHIEIRHLKHGSIGPEQEDEAYEERLDDTEDPQAGQAALRAMLTGRVYRREELPAPDDEIHIRVVRQPGAPDAEDDGPSGADLMFQREPVRLLRVETHPPPLSLPARLAIKHINTRTTYDYIDGVPMAVEVRMHIRSRGIGSLRIDQETVTTVRYEACG